MGERLRTLLAISGLVGAVLVTVAQSQNPLRPVTGDFIARYAGGEVARTGASAYERDLLVVRERALADVPDLVVIPVYDPPPVVAVFRVGSMLPLRVASLVLELASLVAAVVIARLLTRDGGRRVWALATVAMLVSSAARAALANGQTDLVALAAVMLAARWHPVLAVGKPQTTAPTALALFLAPGGRSWWARLPMALAGVAVVALVTHLLAGGATWAGWIDHVGTREETPIDHAALLGLATALGLGVLVVSLVRARRDLAVLDVVAIAALATSLLGVMGGWNPWWHLAQVIGLAPLLLGMRAGALRPTRLQAALLVVAVAAMAGDGYSAYSAGTSFRIWVPVLGVACLMVALVVWRELSPAAALAIVVLNAGITALPMGQGDRTIVAVLVSVVLLHLTLSLRPAPAPWVVAATT